MTELALRMDRARLLDHGFIEGRSMALDIVEHALIGVDPALALRSELTVSGSLLTVGNRTFDLDAFDHIYVVGAGKATYHQAFALEQLLGSRISDGFVAVKYGQIDEFAESLGSLSRIRVSEAAHPVPDEASLAAGREALSIADMAGEADLVVCLISGGSSALCIYPVDGLSLEDKALANSLLVTSGADITEVNTVRRHLSQIKGGRLALKISPAQMLTLAVSDEKTDALDWNTDWTSPDPTSTSDATNVLRKYGLWERMPRSVLEHLGQDASKVETPKSLDGLDICNHLIVGTIAVGEAAVARSRELGLRPVWLTSVLSGESREVGRVLCCIAREISRAGRPFEAPCALIATGETSVRITSACLGSGGANQELAAGACLNLVPSDPIAVCAIDTDGTDGPGDIAGALVDGYTAPRAAAAGIDLHSALLEHDISPALRAVGDALVTGHTGTNVNDLVVLVVLPPSS